MKEIEKVNDTSKMLAQLHSINGNYYYYITFLRIKWQCTCNKDKNWRFINRENSKLAENTIFIIYANMLFCNTDMKFLQCLSQ